MDICRILEEESNDADLIESAAAVHKHGMAELFARRAGDSIWNDVREVANVELMRVAIEYAQNGHSEDLRARAYFWSNAPSVLAIVSQSIAASAKATRQGPKPSKKPKSDGI